LEDRKIVELFWERKEEAISEAARKYGKYCHSVAYNILRSEQDAEECVNDTYARAWNAMPPHKPQRLSAFLGRITRNVALNRYEYERAQKRRSGIELVYDEIAEIVPDASESVADEVALTEAINSYLASLPKRTRMIFVRRYWYLSQISEIAEDMGLSESNVKAILLRARARLKAHLEKEGIYL